MGRGGRRLLWHRRRRSKRWRNSMPKPYDLSHPLLALEPDCTMLVVVEMSQSSWLVAAIVPGLARAPLKKIDADEKQLLRLIERWKAEAAKADRTITRTVLAYEA